MTPEHIKEECEILYKIIEKSEKRLSTIRNTICNHKTTHHGNWSWRVGAIDPAIICTDCGTLIEIIIDESPTLTTF